MAIILKMGCVSNEPPTKKQEVQKQMSKLLNAPCGGSTAAPDKFCALFSIDSGLWNITQSFEFSYLRSLAFGFCQFLAALGIFRGSRQTIHRTHNRRVVFRPLE